MENQQNYKLTNAFITTSISLFFGFKDEDFFKYLENLSYLQGENFYFVFQREVSEEKGEH
jgi:hypothetical protein